ncbi:hypothetical protein ACFWP7_24010 [Streptomyces sp. NPDC058470]|uniref:hypothetical protein n=1 Tax=Streptomyces sp. NPDC058470 TaxID=3346515 RepID=UPI0036523276
MRTHATADHSRHRALVIEDTIGRHLVTGLLGNGCAPTLSRTGFGHSGGGRAHPVRRTAARHGRYGRRAPCGFGTRILLSVIVTVCMDDIDVIAGLDAGPMTASSSRSA